jgi:hypothetical protein
VTVVDRRRARRDELLDLLSAAEDEWGSKLEDQLTKEASYFQKIIDSRTGAGAATGRIREKLTDLTVDKISAFLS